MADRRLVADWCIALPRGPRGNLYSDCICLQIRPVSHSHLSQLVSEYSWWNKHLQYRLIQCNPPTKSSTFPSNLSTTGPLTHPALNHSIILLSQPTHPHGFISPTINHQASHSHSSPPTSHQSLLQPKRTRRQLTPCTTDKPIKTQWLLHAPPASNTSSQRNWLNSLLCLDAFTIWTM